MAYTTGVPSKWYNKNTGAPVNLSELGLGENAPDYSDAQGNMYLVGKNGQIYTTAPYGGRGTYMGMPTYGLQHPEWAMEHPESMGGMGAGGQELPENYTLGSTPVYNAPGVETVPEYSQDYTKLPTYTAPVYDEGAITPLTQQRAAPGLRALRQQISRASGVNYENPNVKRMTLRDALTGYGQGIANVLGAAGQVATSEYNIKYGRLSENAATEFRSRAEQAGAENIYAGDVAKTRYTGALTGWQAREETKRRKAEMDFQAELERYKAETDISKTKFLTEADLRKTKYSKYMDLYTKLAGG